MKSFTLSVVALASVLATGVVARPPRSQHTGEDGEPVQQRSRMTAFVVTDEGPRVECWEIDSFVQGNEQPSPLVMSMEAGNDGLRGVDILTWPSPGTIYPPQESGAHTSGVDLAKHPSSYVLKTGLLYVEIPPAATKSAGSEPEQYFFDNNNGDDWFYFEDVTTSENKYRTKGGEFPIILSTEAASGTELIRFRYNSAPKHKVLHPGRCSFTGLSDANRGKSQKDDDHVQAHLTVQLDL